VMTGGASVLPSLAATLRRQNRTLASLQKQDIRQGGLERRPRVWTPHILRLIGPYHPSAPADGQEPSLRGTLIAPKASILSGK
jgi:hypothetical protein